MTDWPDCALWDFSIALYARPEVEAACLALQDDGGLDVNLVLLAAWAAACGTRLEPALAARLRSVGEGYQETVMRPFRAARKGLGRWPEAAALDTLAAAPLKALRALELDLEHLEQLRLAALVERHVPGSRPTGSALFHANLEAIYPGRTMPASAMTAIAAALGSGRGGAARSRLRIVKHAGSTND